jgi:hypothetical protein
MVDIHSRVSQTPYHILHGYSWWLTLVILATGEAEIRRIMV